MPTVAIVGLGLMGSSLALALKQSDRGYTVVVLCNGDPPAAENALKKVRGLLPRT